jgi:oxidoreductase, short chain dehydrogenase/reductase family
MHLLVLGASSDMGMEFIRRIHSNYDKIIAHYCHMNEKLERLSQEIGNDKLQLIKADFSVETEIMNMIDEIQKMCQGEALSHIVFLPAPICENSKFPKIKWEVFQREIDISLKSLILVLQSFLPAMARQRYGRILIMLSYVVNNIAPAYCSNYVITKYALLGLVKSLATEYSAKGITVNGVSPSWVNTKYIANQPDILKEQNASNNPKGRNLEVEEVVPAMDFLLSDGASCITGENITISCGR